MSNQASGFILTGPRTDVTCYQLTALVSAAEIDAQASLQHYFHPDLFPVAVFLRELFCCLELFRAGAGCVAPVTSRVLTV